MENEKVVAEFGKNSRESVRAIVKTWNGRELFDIRVCYRNDAGELKPTQKGLCLSLDKLPELRQAVEALEKAVAHEPA
ncbi:MAG TPA: transcriptional coactivator p15/PC4 family protein [Elusimicrobiota bacterium]|nr:transcriptional coactivator p15/PC4 family protein [Elusimicrobiota bacterium]